MNKREAERLVETTFAQPYDEGRFRLFARNLFDTFAEKSEGVISGKMIWEAFKGNVTQYKRLGKYTDPEGYIVDILAVKLKDATTLAGARTLQRNFVARYLNGGRGYEREAALVAFYAEGTTDWRFSLVRMEYTRIPDKDKFRKELTPARRYSFLVGGDEKTHTAQKQLATLLQGNAETTLGELERAFNIESVTKEFFEQYKRLFLSLKEELDDLEACDLRIRQEFAEKTIDTATFAKRLLGQIVFLYFLQKKGWLGVGRREDGSLEPWGDGPKDFLRRLFDKQIFPYENFFDELLEPLFYEALARERDESSFYSRFNCRIPFLNGGLFEPVGGYNWQETSINLKNETFKQIFDTFDLYNFTVREDEPLDKEVAVDPEMLGKVFENLLDVTDRKSKGAFYTPREIVHYMCQESLINYLDTALNTVTRPLAPQTPAQDDLFGRPQTKQAPLTEDVYEERVPRADIEAFIRLGDAAQEHDATTTQKGKETDAYRFRTPESVRRSAGAIDAALADIKICDPAIGSGAFPVGMMNEIVRTRLALNVHTGAPERSAYDFKRHAIQESIYGVDIEESAVDIAKLRLWLSLIVDEDNFKRVKPLPNLEYKIVVGNSLLGVEETLFNNEAFETLARLQHDYIGETRPGQKRSLKGRIDALIGELTNDSERFDFKIYFSEVFRQKGGFDVVIGNPPYVNVQAFGAGSSFVQNLKERHKEIWMDKSDLLFYFLKTAIDISREHVTFIISNAFLHSAKAKKLRNYILRKAPIKTLVNIERFMVFDSALITTAIVVLDRQRKSSIADVLVLKEERYGDVTSELRAEENFFEVKFDEDTVFALANGEAVDLNRKIDTVGTELRHIVLVGKGMETAANSVYSFEEVIELFPARYVKKRLTGRAIQKYHIEDSLVDNILYFEEVEDFSDLPGSIRTHLISNRDVLEKRATVKNEGRLWWRYSRPMHKNFYKLDKLWCSYRSSENRFAFDDTGEYLGLTNTTVIFDTNKQFSLKYILGLLNSKLLNYRYHSIGKQTGGGLYEYFEVGVGQLPIRTINFSDPADKQKHDAVVGLVETMLSLHEQKAVADPSERARLEGEIATADAKIDALVYGLYELTGEEIRIVEGSVS